jgi:predicted NAD-dependent protein-ADP-ribosyltransferase YbiA (DUF1768 family)
MILERTMSDKKILSERVMNFFYKKEEGRCFSNFWECLIQIKDGEEVREYDSGEWCFHGEKFIRLGKLCEKEERKRDLLEYGSRFLRGVSGKRDGGFIKKMGRKFILNKEELDLWYNLSVDVQIEICTYKYENYEEVREELVKSKGKVLIHPAMRCSEEKVKTRLWEGKGIVVDGKVKVIGGNMLGKIWMVIRDNE